MLFEKTAIVTGAASGIGYAVAQALRQEGAQVVMADVNEENGEKPAEEEKKTEETENQ